MTDGLRRSAVLACAAVVLTTTGCVDRSPKTLPFPPGSPTPSSPVITVTPSGPEMPPVPTTACLPATPVELEIGPNLLGCMVTPTRWIITNTSRTVILLAADAGSTFPTVTVRPSSATEPKSDVSGLLSGVYDLYRSQDRENLWLQPDAVVDVVWPGDTPGTLTSRAAPADSAALSVVTAVADSLVERGSSQPGGVSVDDISACYDGARKIAREISDGQLAPTTDTWNTVIDDGLTAQVCSSLLPEQAKTELKATILSTARTIWSQLKPVWGKVFLVRIR